MAAPAQMTTADFSGKFYLNKTQSDDVDEVLSLVRPAPTRPPPCARAPR